MIEIIVGLLLLVLAVFGMPLFAVLSGLAFVLFLGADTSIVEISSEHYRLAENPHLITIPLFTLTGYLMSESKAGERLVRVSRAWFGWLPGGLAVVVLIACAFFTTFTGASGVTIVALGGLLFPMLVHERYPEKFSLGLITSSGSIGLLFPPSLPIIIYGIASGANISQLFVAGLIPGFILIFALSIYSLMMGKAQKVNRTPFVLKEAGQALWLAKWELWIPVIIIASIYGIPFVSKGFVTVAEASVISALYVLIVEVFIHKDIVLLPKKGSKPHLAHVIREAMVMVGAILLVLGAALALTNYLAVEEVPMKILAFIRQHIASKTTFLMALTIFLLVVGCLMDIFSAIIVVVPLIAPIAAEYGVDPVHLGVIFLANLEIGYITPPVGLNLFVSSLTFNRPVIQLYRMALPFFLILLVALLLITFNEGLSLWLVKKLGVQ